METPPPSDAAPGPADRNVLHALGPGLVTGASDDDPSGIATYAQAGAAFGYGLLWTLLLTYPLMGAIQEVAARIGRVTGRGIAGNLRRHYPPWLTYPVVGLLLVANTINLGADLGAMGAATRLLLGGEALLYTALFALLCLTLEVWMPYERYCAVLKWLTLALLVYVAAAFVVGVPWGTALTNTLLPSLRLDAAHLAMVVAVLGTTISPYLFFWQASAEVEEIEKEPEDEPLRRAPRQAPAQFWRIKADTYLGMGVSNLIAWCIMLTSAATLHAAGVTEIESAAQAAAALEPVAGPFAKLLFAAGIIGTGLLAVPVLAASAAYALGEALRWPTGLGRKPLEAKGFYAVIAAATLVGLAINLTPVNPIEALVWAAVVNGLVAVPVMALMMLMSSSPKVMGRFTLSPRLRLLGWLATAAMALAAVGLFATWGR
ncbi:Divalent metal cation transporter MntH [Calidithermus terrae]|uniref:Divalent metal cation transporter MntH n=1 Tax=Calidithermus terrae TaxID=1408545 RepID=A0A399DV62_9DEIN|nr:Nramp family divalent metal transporter [Calidithermus terrae]RIH75946.1 Divalent metal cation transporter MntH [Calidithermus terrae]